MTLLSDCNCHCITLTSVRTIASRPPWGISSTDWRPSFANAVCHCKIERSRKHLSIYAWCDISQVSCSVLPKQTRNFIAWRCSFLISILRTDDTTRVHLTARTRTGITSYNFNVQTSFCTLWTGLELPYTHVFVIGRQVAQYVCTKRMDSSFGSTLVEFAKSKKYKNEKQ